MNEDPFRLAEARLARLRPLSPTDRRGVPRVCDRRHRARAAPRLRWTDATAADGPRETPRNRLVRRAAKGVFSPALHRGCGAIERMSGRLKDVRRIATRCGKLARHCFAAAHVAAVGCWS